MFERVTEKLPKDDVRLNSLGGGTHSLAVPRPLQRFWDECGSGYFGGLALHVLGTGFEEAFHDIWKWNDALSSFRWLVPKTYVAFAEDPFGTQFFFDGAMSGSPVYSLVIQDAVMFEVAESVSDFFLRLADDDQRDAILNASFYLKCLTDDASHRPGNHLTLRVPRCLGGNEKMGLIDVDAAANVSFLGQLLEQAQRLTPTELAARVRFVAE